MTVAAGTSAKCHNAGKPNVHIDGPDPSDIQTLTMKEAKILFQICRSFNEFHAETKQISKDATPLDVSRPGDDFCVNGTWKVILAPLKWKLVRKDSDGSDYWLHPKSKSDAEWSLRTGLEGQHDADFARSTLCPPAALRALVSMKEWVLLRRSGSPIALGSCTTFLRTGEPRRCYSLGSINMLDKSPFRFGKNTAMSCRLGRFRRNPRRSTPSFSNSLASDCETMNRSPPSSTSVDSTLGFSATARPTVQEGDPDPT